MTGFDAIKVSYKSDPQLDWPISNGDVTVLESLFNSQGNNTVVSRLSLTSTTATLIIDSRHLAHPSLFSLPAVNAFPRSLNFASTMLRIHS